VARLYECCRAALADPGVQQRLAGLGAIGLGTAPAEFDAWLKRERAAMEVVAREANITAD
jgi:tripartite-type tricarboxylate transporter receptor subunit TctC